MLAALLAVATAMPASPAFRYVAPETAAVDMALHVALRGLLPDRLDIRYDRRVDLGRRVRHGYPGWESLLHGEGLDHTRRATRLEVRPAGLTAAVEHLGPRRGRAVWRVDAGESLREVLERWCARAGIGLEARTDRRYRLEADWRAEGTMLEAVGALRAALAGLPHPPVADLTADGTLLRLTHRAPALALAEAPPAAGLWASFNGLVARLFQALPAAGEGDDVREDEP